MLKIMYDKYNKGSNDEHNDVDKLFIHITMVVL